MRVAVITPHHRTRPRELAQCLQSVIDQSVRCTHIVVCDGDDFPSLSVPAPSQIIRLPQPHGIGNTARAIGSISAIAQDFDAIALLDSDNWFEATHIEKLIELHERTGAAFCSSARQLVTEDGESLGFCPEVDGESFVDTNCMFYLRKSFSLIAAWYLMPRVLNLKGGGDRWVWHRIRQSGIKRAFHTEPTVNYRTRYALHYRLFGKPVPPGAKECYQVVID